MAYSLYVLVALFLSACTPPPGNWGLIEGVERVFPLEEVRVIEHPGTLREVAGACNRLHWGRGERSGVLLTAEFISRQRSGLSAAMICYAAMEK